MWYRLQRIIVCLLAITAFSLASSPTQAGWGHRWGHHHHHYHGGFYGSYYGLGFPSYSYSSFYLSVPRARLYYPSYSVGYYSSYYAPPVSYSVALPTYYYATPSYYVAPTYYSAPVVYPSSSCCDPCATNYPSVSYPSTTTAPTYSSPEYSTGTESQSYPSSSQFAGSTGGSFVDRMLGRSNSVSRPGTPLRSDSTNFASTVSSDRSVRTVSTLKPVAPSSSIPANIDQLTPIPDALLKTADEMFAIGGYEQAASAYARLAVRYGDHDHLAVRRFIALVASGDHAQASIVYELAMLNDRPLTTTALPVGGLSKLYGVAAQNRNNHIESLASYALKSDNEALAMRMVGTWLELDGQSDRAATFLQRADMLSEPSESTARPTLANRLADAQLAR